MIASEIEHQFLFRCVSEKRWRKLKQEDFCLLYAEEVGEIADVVLSSHVADLPAYGPCVVHVIENGLAVLEAPLGRFSLYETEKRYKEREHLRQWAEFARGYWTEKTPQEAGYYFVRDLDLRAQSIRELRKVGGRLKDVSAGTVRPGRVSEWLGEWWSVRLPALPE